MNVLYRCPKCGRRHFAPSGGTKYKCAKCTVEFKQVEDYGGPDFLNFDPQTGTNLTKTGHLKTKGMRSAPTGSEDLKSIYDDMDFDTLKAVYSDKSGLIADGRWGRERLEKELEILDEQQT